MKTNLCLLTILCFTVVGSVQAQQLIEGQVNDLRTGQPIAGVNINLLGSELGTTTDANGLFTLNIPSFPAALQISHIGYRSSTLELSSPTDTFQLVFLVSKVNVLEEVVVSSSSEATPLSDERECSILDFEITDQHLYWIEHYGTFSDKYLVKADLEGQKLDSFRLQKMRKVQGLYRSCNQVVYLQTQSKVYEIGSSEGELDLVDFVSVDTFENFIKPCKLLQDNSIYYLFSSSSGMIKKVSRYDLASSSAELLKTIADERHLAQLREDVGYMRSGQRVSSMEANNFVENGIYRHHQQDSDFLLQVYYKSKVPVYLYGISNEVVLVNNPEQRIEFYDVNELIKTVAIEYPTDKKWLKRVLWDAKTKSLYTLFKNTKGIQVHRVDLQSGQTMPVFQVDTNPGQYEEIEIQNDYIYFLKDGGKNQSRNELLKQRLN
ncbi:MAG: carboxypeptidase-like regulatory domain-containing protein [Bacteroidota bacterium]